MSTETNYASLFFSGIVNDVDTLEKNVKEFPFSSVSRFLLLYHYKKNNNPGFENLSKQTGIYLTNPFWIQYQLSKIDDGISSLDDSLLSKKQNETIEENIPVSAEESDLSANKQITQIPVSESQTADESEIKNNFSEQEEKLNENIEENIPVSAEEFDLSVDKQITQIPVSESRTSSEGEIKNNFSEQEEKLNENIEENIPVSAEESDLSVDKQITQIPVSEFQIPNEIEIKNDLSQQEEKQNETIEVNVPVSAEESDLSADKQITQIPVSESQTADESEIKNAFSQQEEKQNETIEENIPVSAEESDLSADKQITQIPVSESQTTDESEIKNAFSQQEEKLNENIEENIPESAEESDLPADKQITQIPVSENDQEEQIPFEPLHTVDYFASQGIRISEEALENDHLGRQVKSFTAWLKSMKKLHPGQLPEQNEVIEKIIQANAEVSNQNANVLTEAMAEVLIKQNKKEKAIEMYQKLSLINPSKSAYFAAKIESLKTI